jgi:hypothetical protein
MTDESNDGMSLRARNQKKLDESNNFVLGIVAYVDWSVFSTRIKKEIKPTYNRTVGVLVVETNDDPPSRRVHRG